MHVIIGLGNPGSEYDGTRHNIGFSVVNALSAIHKIKFREGRGDFLYASGWQQGEQFLLVKPMTYMNNSGIAVKEIVEQHGVSIKDLLVVVDDFQLPLGSLRIRLTGSDGGHNGLASIIYLLESDTFPRLRCGIRSDAMPKDKNKLRNFVLAQFDTSETEQVKKMIQNASDAVLTVMRQGLRQAMNEFNNITT